MEIGRLVAGLEPDDRRPLLIWGAGAVLAVAVWVVASALAAEPIDPIQLAALPDSATPAGADQSPVAKLEARNAQLLRAIVTLSDDNDAMRARVAELERRFETVSEIPALAGRLSQMEGEVAHIASTMPFARTTTTTTVTATLTDPVPLTPAPAPFQAPANPANVAAAPVPPESNDATPTAKNADRLTAEVAAEAEVAANEPPDPALEPDPIETASIDPDEPVDVIGEGDAMDSAELQEMEVALADPSPPVVNPPVAAKAPPVPVPTPRPPQIATRTVFGVDLGRFESVAKVQTRWKALTKKDPALVKPLKPKIATRDGAAGRETYLVAGPFADAGAAAVACAKFKAIGATCRTTNYSAD